MYNNDLSMHCWMTCTAADFRSIPVAWAYKKVSVSLAISVPCSEIVSLRCIKITQDYVPTILKTGHVVQ